MSIFRRQIKFILLVLLLWPLSVYSKGYVRDLGLGNESPKQIMNIPRAVKTFGVGKKLPSDVDLSQNFPAIGYQGMQNSCVAWAVGYAVKSYQEKIEHGWAYSKKTLFSPAYIYNQINHGKDSGSAISEAMGLLVNQGAATFATMPYNPKDYWSKPNAKAQKEAKKFREKKYARIDGSDIATVKSYLAQGVPVVFGMSIDDAFYTLNKKHPVYDAPGGGYYGGHAMALVGYDDHKYGGAFKVFNSWSTDWGDNGYAWITYQLWPTLKPWALVMFDIKSDQKPAVVTPDKPAGLTASKNEYADKIILSWSKIDNADSYAIFRWNQDKKQWIKVKTTDKTTWSDTGLKPGMEISYYVQAVRSGRFSRPSDEVSGSTKAMTVTQNKKPAPPRSLTASRGQSANSINLRWQTVKNALQYKVYHWNKSLNKWKLIATTKETSFTHKNLKAGQEYYYAVFAENHAGVSRPSSIIVGMTKAKKLKKPSAPAGFTVSRGDYRDRICLSWRVVPEAEEYRIYRWYPNSGQWKKIQTTDKTEYTDTAVSVNKRYYYTLIAANSLGHSHPLQPLQGFAYARLRAAKVRNKSYTKLVASEGIFSDFVLLAFHKIPADEVYVVFRKSQKDTRWIELDTVTPEKKKEIKRFLTGMKGSQKHEYYIDRTAKRGMIYTYKIAPFDLKGDTRVSPAASGWVKSRVYHKPPAPPTKSLIYQRGTRAGLKWQPVDGAQVYYIYRWSNKDKKFVKIAYSLATTWVDHIERGQKFRYALSSYNPAGESKTVEIQRK